MKDSLEKILSPLEEKWEKVRLKSDASLLRVVLLRELVRKIHSERSFLLTQGSVVAARKFESLEMDLEKAGDFGPLDQPLSTVLSQKFEASSEVEFPESFQQLDPSKFTRADRKWEFRMLIEGAKHGWTPFLLIGWIEYQKAEQVHSEISHQLWPEGVNLFVEAAPSNETIAELWKGQWYVLLRPNANEVKKRVLSIFNSPQNPEPPRWEKL